MRVLRFPSRKGGCLADCDVVEDGHCVPMCTSPHESINGVSIFPGGNCGKTKPQKIGFLSIAKQSGRVLQLPFNLSIYIEEALEL